MLHKLLNTLRKILYNIFRILEDILGSIGGFLIYFFDQFGIKLSVIGIMFSWSIHLRILYPDILWFKILTFIETILIGILCLWIHLAILSFILVWMFGNISLALRDEEQRKKDANSSEI